MKNPSFMHVLLVLGFIAVLLPARALALSSPIGAPEVDPSLAVGAIALLGGALAVMRSRRSR